jgi:hypothetical protein
LLKPLIDKDENVLFIAMDVSAAFDTVHHKRLLRRLHEAGVSSTALNWFTSYLEDRTQVVKINQHLSQPKPLTSGVPQGSVLGPLLFNVYMAPLGKLLQNFPSISHHIYADDVFIYASFTSANKIDTVTNINNVLNVISRWMQQNYLCLNPSKTICQLFHNERSTVLDIPSIFVQGKKIEVYQKGSVRCLGAQLDCNLNMNDFVSTTCRNSFLQLRMLGNVRRSIGRRAAKLLCHALVLSRIDFCLPLLTATSQCNINRLQRIINHAARIV